MLASSYHKACAGYVRIKRASLLSCEPWSHLLLFQSSHPLINATHNTGAQACQGQAALPRSDNLGNSVSDPPAAKHTKYARKRPNQLLRLPSLPPSLAHPEAALAPASSKPASASSMRPAAQASDPEPQPQPAFKKRRLLARPQPGSPAAFARPLFKFLKPRIVRPGSHAMPGRSNVYIREGASAMAVPSGAPMKSAMAVSAPVQQVISRICQHCAHKCTSAGKVMSFYLTLGPVIAGPCTSKWEEDAAFAD